MRTFGRLCVIAIACLCLSGCWSRKELNDLGIATATGFDREDGKWVVTYQTVVPSAMVTGTGGPSGGTASQATVHVLSTKAKTIREAVAASELEYPRLLYFAHNNVLVIGEEAAKAGISEIIDLFFRNPDSRETVLVLLAEKKASDVLTKFVPPERLPGAAMAEMLRKEERFTSIFPAVSMYKLALKINSDAGGAGVPEIVLAGESKQLESLDIYKKTSAAGKLRLSRLGVFRGDRLVGWMNREESLGLSWLSDQLNGTNMSFDCPGSDGGGGKATFRVESARTRVTPGKKGDHYTMAIHVKAKGIVVESTCTRDLKLPGNADAMEKQIERRIRQQMETGWQAVKRLRVDLPGFADKVHRAYPREWKRIKGEWEHELERTELTYRVEATVRRTGLFQKSFDELQKERKGEYGGVGKSGNNGTTGGESP
ncbi:Ger(x)C family spore germination protein [Paenibacillus sp. GYB003]|uniref:Ger(x)C family spore germination protein n=1 Tax=Paenibacillus sp. GYB003 TaxID=2994392 RepID=UPI002F962B86